MSGTTEPVMSIHHVPRGCDSVTSTTRRLLDYWADPYRDNRVLFCQREAAETAIFLAEVAGKGSWKSYDDALTGLNNEINAGLPRIALKMATGTGKTVVMAMLIAWHTLNKVANPHDNRYASRFLVVAPGVTIRDRLRVLQPEDPPDQHSTRELIELPLLDGVISRVREEVGPDAQSIARAPFAAYTPPAKSSEMRGSDIRASASPNVA